MKFQQKFSHTVRRYLLTQEDRNKFIIKPRRYDTALFIKTSRQKKRKNSNYEFGGRMKFQSGSYASELNRYGSEFEVFKKKDKANKRKIANISEKNLERVIVRPQNHKGYAAKALARQPVWLK